MAINPAIALGVESPKPLDMLGAYGKAMSIRELVDSARMREQQGAALGQKMQFDQQEHALNLATKKIGIRQQLASGLIALPSEQRPAQYPFFRQQYIDLTGDSNIPEQYDEGLVMQEALRGQDPNKMQEAIRAEAQRTAYMDAMRGLRKPQGPSNVAPGTTGEASVQMNEDGTANLTAPQVNVQDSVSRMPNPNQLFSLYDLIQQDPRIAGTPLAQQTLENALKLKQEAEQSPSRGMQYIKGEDGQTYVVKNGVREDVISTGNDPNAQFWRGPEGQPIANQARIDADLTRARAGATNVRVGVDAYEKKLNQLDAESVADARKGAEQAAGAASDARAIAEILKGQNSGKWTEMQAALGQWLPGSQYANVTSVVSLAEGIRGRAAPAMRVPGSGAMSDFETKQLLSIFPQLIQSDAGRELTARVLERVAERQAIAADIKDEMVRGGTYSVREFNKRIKAEFGEGLLTPEEKATLKRLQSGEKPQMGSRENPYKIRGDDGFDAIPEGSFFIGPDGVPRQKPAAARPKR